MKSMLNDQTDFIYLAGEQHLFWESIFVARIHPEIKIVDQLISSFYYSLWFPGWFGFNWDALNDCLCDLSWTGDARVYIIHQCVPQIEEAHRKIYLEILRGALVSWRRHDATKLSVIFTPEDRNSVQSILGGDASLA